MDNQDQARAPRSFRMAVIAFVVAALLLLCVATVSAYLRNASLADACHAENSDRTALRAILQRSEHLSLIHKHPGFTEEAIRDYYQKAVRELAPVPC